MNLLASRRLAALWLVAGSAGFGLFGPMPFGAAAADERAGVVVELYTSQGCSSCPAADQFLAELAKRDDIVPLAFHVDYWDHLGWKDPYARPENAKRQRAYVAALGARFVYTPQMVVDGRFEAVGSKKGKIETLIARAVEARAAAPAIALRDRDVAIAAGAPPAAPTAVFAIYFARTRANDVPSGENSGRRMATTNVVRGVVRLGPWEGKPFAATLDPAAQPGDADGVAILVQTLGYGPVLGARLFDLK
ncbi:MAG: DUF1223 domain-containing protein [Alphaproteobacteria bacterium]|nr:DUF1223 domain-containing protein [Alphaproteobacteria bacterium]